MKTLEFLSIEIKVQDETVLVILIHSDGTINRKGDGSENPDLPFAMGMGDTKGIFKELVPLITNDFESCFNKVFDDPDRKGKICTLEIKLGDESNITGCKFIYGLDSIGPPIFLNDFVIKSIELTNSWYQRACENA
jgi:hypothetical protein